MAMAGLLAITAGSENRVPFCLATAMPAVTRSTISSRSYSTRVASMFNISRPVEVAESITSERDRAQVSRSRNSLTVFEDVDQRPANRSAHTTMLSPGSAWARSFFIPGPLGRRLIARGDVGEPVAVLHPGGN